VGAGDGEVAKVVADRPEQRRESPTDPVQLASLGQRLPALQKRSNLLALIEDLEEQLLARRVLVALEQACHPQF
jgi:hypothetical protein